MITSRIHKKVIEIFEINPNRPSPKGWLMTKHKCPWCGKADYHFGIRLNKKKGKHTNEISFHCFKCSQKGGEFLLFRELGMEDFVQIGEYVKPDDPLINKILEASQQEKEGIDVTVVSRHPPFGFRRVMSDPYLDNRGFLPWQFETYVIGKTILDDKLKDYVIFLVTEDGENKGFIARHVWDKGYIKYYEEQTGKKVLRYRNEGGVDFDKLLFGYDEIIKGETHTVILVEGVTDKTNVDMQLGLHKSDSIKCCACFGKKISEAQVQKLLNKDVKIVILSFDPDAVNESKRYSELLRQAFEKVRVLTMPGDKDPGDLNTQELHYCIDNWLDPFNFAMNRLQKRKLSLE